MKARIAIAMVALAGLSVSPVFAQDHNHADHAAHIVEQAATPAPNNMKLPADEEGAKARLSASPRHSEWVKVDVSGGTPVNTFVVYPERRDKAPVVLVIQEIFGLSDWIRGVADQLAAEGFIAVAPDLLSGHGPNGGGTDTYATRDDVTKAVMSLPQPEMTARLDAVRAYGLKLPAANGRSATVGFCFGGSQSFAYAVSQPALNAAVVYYGTAPNQPGGAQGSFTPAATLAQIKAPVLGLYGGADARIGATIPATEAKMKELGKSYEPHTFDAAGHGFLRAQTAQSGANMKASEQAWPMTVAFIRKHADSGASKSQ
jgi:carboxymethylenebutenolidase